MRLFPPFRMKIELGTMLIASTITAVLPTLVTRKTLVACDLGWTAPKSTFGGATDRVVVPLLGACVPACCEDGVAPIPLHEVRKNKKDSDIRSSVEAL
jgi:hypothetical protein